MSKRTKRRVPDPKHNAKTKKSRKKSRLRKRPPKMDVESLSGHFAQAVAALGGSQDSDEMWRGIVAILQGSDEKLKTEFIRHILSKLVEQGFGQRMSKDERWAVREEAKAASQLPAGPQQITIVGSPGLPEPKDSSQVIDARVTEEPSALPGRSDLDSPEDSGKNEENSDGWDDNLPDDV